MTTPHSKEVVAEVITMWNAGSSGAIIARALGLPSRNSVIGIVNRHGGEKRVTTMAMVVMPTPKQKKVKQAFEKVLSEAATLEEGEPTAVGPIGVSPDVGCQYPHGDTSTREWQMCGHPQRQRSPYCEYHYLKLRRQDQPRANKKATNYMSPAALVLKP